MSMKLTAEQVREVIKRYSTELLGGSRLFIERDWQAIADEFNAALDGGECENLIDNWSVHDSKKPDFECSECHATGHADGNVTGGEYLFCPRCGARVQKAAKR